MKPMFVRSAVALVAGLFAAPYWVGVQAEQRFQDGVSQLNASLDTVSVRTSEYQRGWFTSSVATEIAPRAVKVAADGGESASGETLTLRHVITHGPIPMNWIDGEWFLPPIVAHIRTLLEGGTQLQAALSAKRPDGPPLTIHSEARIGGSEEVLRLFGSEVALQVDTEIHYDGSGDSHVLIPGFQEPVVKDGETVEWKGLEGKVHFESGLKKGSVDAEAPLLSVVADNHTSRLQDLRLKGEFELADSGLWLGSYEFFLGSLQAADEETGGQPLNLNGLGFLTSVLPAGDNVAIRSRFQFKEIEIPAAMAQAYGGPEKVGAAVDLTLSGLDVPALLNLQKISEASAGAEPEMAAAQFIQAFQQLLVASLAHSPEVDIPELYLALPDGKLEANAWARLDGGQPMDMSSPTGMLSALTVNLEAKAPIETVRAIVATQRRPAIEQARAQGIIDLKDDEVESFLKQDVALRIKEFIDRGWVVLNAGVLSTRLQLDKGNILVNGKPANLGSLMP
ncbi:MAG: YdgA family protein [Chromatiales bacterium]|nr:YdgA family protein [Chromatiales bacterium]